MNRHTSPILLFILLINSACVSLDTYDTADSLSQGEARVGLSLSGLQPVERAELAPIPTLSPYIRYGATERLDIEYQRGFGPILHGKYTFIQNADNSVALKLGIGYLETEIAHDPPEAATAMDVYTNLLISNKTSSHTTTFGPRLILRKATGALDSAIYGGVYINRTYQLTEHLSLVPEISIYIRTRGDLKFEGPAISSSGGALHFTM